MSNLQETIKEKLLLTDEDIDPLLKGDFKALMAQNREAAIRVGIVYGACLAGILVFLALFSVFGALFKVVLSLMIFGFFGFVAFVAGEKNVLKATQYPAFSYFLIFIFAIMTLSMFSDISAQGSFLSKFLLFLIVIGLGGGAYTIRTKAAERGFTSVQLVLVTLILSSFLLSMQAASVQFGVDRDIALTKERAEIRRLKEAEKMRMNQASSYACTTDEECRKMNTKKNSYYSDYEEFAQDACEHAVAKEISGRFEWTVSAKDYKFTNYQVDVLKDEIILMGNRAQLIANTGEKTPLNYICVYNTKKKTTKASIK